MIRLDNVTFKYPNGYIAVDDLSLEIMKGEKVAIIGQNGAGKTTTVKMMNGLLRPFSGTVYVDNEDIKNKTTATVSKKVGYVFQNPSDQLFNKTVYDEIAYALKKNKINDEVIKKRVEYASKICGIENFLDQNPYELSLGIRKFVTIAIVIANDCDVIILDEPTAGQDLFGNERLKEIMNELNSKGKTIIVITHDMDFVIDNFERIIVMANKKLRFDGKAIDVFYNDELLEISKLKKPICVELAQKLKIEERILTPREFVKAYLKRT
ncbi:energy-coupling factor ABC transporter ATP-binding protein [Oceanivirga salmonicida]|uniref:energy-coupling factor ABC transporter ATP-binding protein n=1 Tax=Oceanivirga salmonicida TaxID=1769291 RepID=UPI0012E2BC57|nr:ABC transporter ATP-binding protein [Oceanivirga salmonicida]